MTRRSPAILHAFQVLVISHRTLAVCEQSILSVTLELTFLIRSTA